MCVITMEGLGENKIVLLTIADEEECQIKLPKAVLPSFHMVAVYVEQKLRSSRYFSCVLIGAKKAPKSFSAAAPAGPKRKCTHVIRLTCLVFIRCSLEEH
jgi:hypothetical protein